MTSLKEVPTEELLSFQDFTPVHNPTSSDSALAQINVNILDKSAEDFGKPDEVADPLEDEEESQRKCFAYL